MITFSEFAQKNNLSLTDQLVGYSDTSLGGEKRWSYSTLLNAVSTETLNQVTGTSPISVSNGTISISAASTSGAGTMSSTDKTRLDDASSVNGLVKCNGSGDFSAAVAGTDYLTSATLSASPVGAKAWVNFDGTFATSPFTVGSGIRKSYNVSSVTRTSTGAFTVNFTTDMADVNYSAIISVSDDNLMDPVIAYFDGNSSDFTISSIKIVIARWNSNNNAWFPANRSFICLSVFN